MAEIRSVSVRLDADIASYVAKMRLAAAETDRAFGSSSRGIDSTNSSLSRTESTLSKVDTEARRVDTSMRRLTSSMNGNGNGFSRAAARVDGFLGKLRLIPALAIVGTAALIPLAAAATGVVAALTAPLVFVGGGVTLFALLGGAAISKTNEQFKAIDTLKKSVDSARVSLEQAERSAGKNASTSTSVANAQDRLNKATHDYHEALKGISPQQREFHGALETLQSDFSKFIRGPAGQDLLTPFTQGLQIASDLLPKLTPIIHTVSNAVSGLLQEFDRYAQSPGFARFLREFTEQLGPDISAIGHILGNIGPGIGDLLIILGKQLSPKLMQQLAQIGDDFSNWAASKDARHDVHSFVQYLHEVGPDVANVISAVARALTHMVEALAPLGPPSLRVIAGISDAISGIPIPVLTALSGMFVSAVALQKVGGFKALSFASKGIGGGPGGIAGSVLGGGVQKVFVVNMPLGGPGTGTGPGGVAGGGKSLLSKAGTLGLGVAAIGALNAAGTDLLMKEYGKTLGGGVAAAVRATLSLPNPELAGAGFKLGTTLVGGVSKAVAGGVPGLFNKVFGGPEVQRASASIKSVGTAVESLHARLGKASQAMELVGHSADRNFHGVAENAVERLGGKIDSISGAKASQAMDLVGHSAQRNFSQAGAQADSLQGHVNALHGKELDVNVNAGQSLSVLRTVAAQLNAIRSKTITLTTQRVTGGRDLAGADGMTVPGMRAPYADKVFAHLAPGEEVISNRRGQADRFRPLLKRINAMADGGTAGTHLVYPQGSGPEQYALDQRRIRAVHHELHNLEHALKDSSKELDQEKQKRQELIQQRQQLVSTIRGGFRSDLFGVVDEGGIWGSGIATDPRSILRQDIQNAREYRDDIRRLRHRGISNSVLSQITTLDEAEQAVGLSRHELREIGRLYRVRQRASQAAGGLTGNTVFAQRIAEQTKVVKRQADDVHDVKQEIKQANHHLAQLERELKHDTPKKIANSVNKPAATAARRRRTG